jgi:hypothetical protein
MADATDLKSVGPKGPCGFESRHRHHKSYTKTAPRLSLGAVFDSSSKNPVTGSPPEARFDRDHEGNGRFARIPCSGSNGQRRLKDFTGVLNRTAHSSLHLHRNNVASTYITTCAALNTPSRNLEWTRTAIGAGSSFSESFSIPDFTTLSSRFFFSTWA